MPKIIDRCKTKTDLAFEMFLWGALNKFYYDENKRTSRLVCNYKLISNGQEVSNVKAKDRLEFYNTRKSDNIVEFFYKKCLEKYI